MSKPVDKPKRRRWLPRWSMRAMFVIITIICLVLGLVVRPAEEQRRAVAALREIDGVTIWYDYRIITLKDGTRKYLIGRAAWIRNPRPKCLRDWVSIDYFADVVVIVYQGLEIRDDDLCWLRHFSKLEALGLHKCDRVSDFGLTSLKSLKNLKNISIHRTSVTAEGIQDLQQALPNCKIHSDF